MPNRKMFLIAAALALAACKPQTSTTPAVKVLSPPKGMPPAPTTSTRGKPVRAAAMLVISSACPDVTTCGAVHDGMTDDTNSIRQCEAQCAALAASSGMQMCLPFPDGTYIVSQHLHTARCIDVDQNVVIGCPSDVFPGETRTGAILKMAAMQGTSTRPIYMGSPYAGVTNLTVDGNKANQGAYDEHKAGMIVVSTHDITVQHVDSHDNQGDAIYVGGPTSTNILIDDINGHDNDRDGVAITGGSFITTSNSTLSNNKAQDYDTEPAVPLHDVVLTGSTIDAGTADTTTYVVTISGAGIDSSKHSWNLDVGNSTINGPVFIVYADNSSLHDCTITQTMATVNYSPVAMQGASSGFTIANNHLVKPTGSVNKTGVTISGNATVGAPTGLVVNGNTMDLGAILNPVGVMIQGTRDVSVTGNTVNGNPASTINYCVSARAAAQGVPLVSLVVDGNTCSGFPINVIAFSAVTPTVPIQYVEVNSNTFTDSTVRATNTGTALNYNMGGTIGLENAVQSSTVENNILTGVPNNIKPWPSTPVLVGGTRGAGGQWNVAGNPNGQIVEIAGATAVQRDAGNSTWTKTSDPGLATGWTQP